MSNKKVSIPKVVRLKEKSEELRQVKSRSFNSKSGSIKRRARCYFKSPRRSVSIPKVVRLKALSTGIPFRVRKEFQFQKWFD